jgi:hypothetical protein
MATGIALSAAAFAAGLLVTVVLAAYLTPRRWWRRANARALAVLALGTLGITAGLLWLADRPGAATAPAPRLATPAPSLPHAGRSYRVLEALNLRVAGGVGARRVVVVPGGAAVVASGDHEGDWWRVTAQVNGAPVEGWANSLWLRRADEHR